MSSEWAKQKAHDWLSSRFEEWAAQDTETLAELLDEAITEGKRQDRKKLEKQNNGLYSTVTNHHGQVLGSGAYWAQRLKEQP